MPISLVVKTPVYEGPLEILLELIEKRKLLINDISLASVCDEYIVGIKAMEELPVGETADFVALAATLLLIKSRSLLPSLQLSDEESRDIKELQYRLALYQIIKETSRGLSHTAREAHILYEGSAPDAEPLFIPDETVTRGALRNAAQMLIEGFPQNIALPKVEVKKIISIEEMIERLAKRVSSAMSVSFREFTKANASASRGEFIVSFLALLELVKQGILRASQEEKHGDITLESDAVGTPTYE